MSQWQPYGYGQQQSPYGYPPPPPPPRPFPLWAILLIVGGAIAVVGFVGVAVHVVGASSAAVPPTPTVRPVVVPAVPVVLHVTLRPPTTRVGEETHLLIAVQNHGARPLGRCTVAVHASGVDVSWPKASKNVELLGLFDSARSFVVPDTIAANDVKLYELVFIASAPGRLVIGVTATDDVSTEEGRTGAGCTTVPEQKQTISVLP